MTLMVGHWITHVVIYAVITFGGGDPTTNVFQAVQIALILSFLSAAIFGVVSRQFPLLRQILEELMVSATRTKTYLVWAQFVMMVIMFMWYLVDSLRLGVPVFIPIVYGMVSVYLELFKMFEYLLFTSVMHSIKRRFLAVNVELLHSCWQPKLLCWSVSGLAGVSVPGASVSRTTALRRAHQRTVDLLHGSRRCFEWALVSLLGLDAIFLLTSSYRILLGPPWERKPQVALRSSCWLALHAAVLLHLVCACSSTMEQGKKTADLVHRYLNTDGLRLCEREELKLFSMQLMHCKMNITLLGLFSLNRRLITSVLGTLATYLVILAQFKMSAIISTNSTTSDSYEAEDVT